MKGFVLWFVLGAAAAAAQSPSEVGPLYREALLGKAKVGQWVSYAVEGGHGRTSYWRMAVVGEEKDRLGRDALWLEVEISEHPSFAAPMAQMRALVAKNKGFSPQGITRLFLGAGIEAPKEVSSEAIAHFASVRPGLKMGDTFEKGSAPFYVRCGHRMRLWTPAGWVWGTKTELLSGETVLRRIWRSSEIPLLQLARLEIPGLGHSMNVQGFGTGAAPQMPLPPPEAPKFQLENPHATPTPSSFDSRPSHGRIFHFNLDGGGDGRPWLRAALGSKRATTEEPSRAVSRGIPNLPPVLLRSLESALPLKMGRGGGPC